MQKPIITILSLFLLTTFACDNSDTSLRNTRNDAINGVITYRDDSKIPPTSEMTIRLLELEADGSSKVIKELKMESGSSGRPFPFTLPYDKQAINKDKKYALDIDIDFIVANLYYTLEPIEVLSNGLKRDVTAILVKGPKPVD